MFSTPALLPAYNDEGSVTVIIKLLMIMPHSIQPKAQHILECAIENTSEYNATYLTHIQYCRHTKDKSLTCIKYITMYSAHTTND